MEFTVPQEKTATGSNVGQQMPHLPSRASWDRTVPLLRRVTQQAFLAAGLVGSIALLPIAMVQGAVARRRVPILPPAKAPLSGRIAGVGKPIRLLAVGESSVCGVGVSRGDETVARGGSTRSRPNFSLVERVTA